MLEQAYNLACIAAVIWCVGAFVYLFVGVFLVVAVNGLCSTLGWRYDLSDEVMDQYERFNVHPLAIWAAWFIALPFQVLWFADDAIKAWKVHERGKMVRHERPYQGCV